MSSYDDSGDLTNTYVMNTADMNRVMHLENELIRMKTLAEDTPNKIVVRHWLENRIGEIKKHGS